LNIPEFYHSWYHFSSTNVTIILEGTSVLSNLPRFILYCENNKIAAEKQPPYLVTNQVTSPFGWICGQCVLTTRSSYIGFFSFNGHKAKLDLLSKLVMGLLSTAR